MGQRIFSTRVELDHDTDDTLEKWGELEGKSKRRHAAILIRKLIVLRETQPAELVRLGLIDRLLAN